MKSICFDFDTSDGYQYSCIYSLHILSELKYRSDFLHDFMIVYPDDKAKILYIFKLEVFKSNLISYYLYPNANHNYTTSHINFKYILDICIKPYKP